MCYSNKLNFGQNWVEDLLVVANDNVLFSKPFTGHVMGHVGTTTSSGPSLPSKVMLKP